MKTFSILFLLVSMCVSSFAAAVFPASTNGNNVFTGTNLFLNSVSGNGPGLTNLPGTALKASNKFDWLEPNTNIVLANMTNDIAWGIGNFQGTNTHFLSVAGRARIRQSGFIDHLEIWLKRCPTNDIGGFNTISNWYFEVWRQVTPRFSANSWPMQCIYRENMIGQLTNMSGSGAAGFTYTNLLLSNAVFCLPGDLVAHHVYAPGPNTDFQSWTVPFYNVTPGGDSGYVYYGDITNYAYFDWGPCNANSGAYLKSSYASPWVVKMRAPSVVAMGDSILASSHLRFGFLDLGVPNTTEQTNEWDTGYTHIFGRTLAVSLQNLGIGSRDMTNQLPTMTNFVVSLHPKLLILEGGVNDLHDATLTNAFFDVVSNILSSCRANGIKVLLQPIMPWTDGTDAELYRRDVYNSNSYYLATNFFSDIVVGIANADGYVGTNAPTGPAGNLWDQLAWYNLDGVHYTKLAQGRIAQSMTECLTTNWSARTFAAERIAATVSMSVPTDTNNIYAPLNISAGDGRYVPFKYYCISTNNDPTGLTWPPNGTLVTTTNGDLYIVRTNTINRIWPP